MKRNLGQFEDREFDLIVVGGGIFGACAAWDASLRGLSVALIERSDFGGATSANSLKMIHGGIRYLQHLDFFRVRQSSAERRAFLRIAPHLVRPLPVVVPTYGHLQKGKAFLRAGMAVYDLLTLDKNRGVSDSARRVPLARAASRNEVLELFPGLPGAGLTGGMIFSDGQMVNPPRLVLAFVRSAAEAGAVVANYLEVVDFLRKGDRVVGVRARDPLSRGDLEVRGRCVLNATGPFAERLLERGFGRSTVQRGTYSRDACFVVKRLFDKEYALAIAGSTSDPDARLSRGTRHLFLAPWRDFTLVGVWHVVYGEDPDAISVSRDELASFVAEVTGAYPGLDLDVEDIAMVNSGLVPFGENPQGAIDLRYGHRSRLIDHSAAEGIDGLVTLIGVRYTTGRYEAGRAVDLVARKLSRKTPRCRTASTPVFGGDIASVSDRVPHRAQNDSLMLSPETLDRLSQNYGSAINEVLDMCQQDPGLATTLGGTAAIEAEVLYAVRAEMAVTLEDVVCRRTDLGTGESPSVEVVRRCSELMAGELEWTPQRVEEELSAVRRYPHFWTRS